MENARQITALNNALRPNPCFREITGIRSIKTDSGHDLIQIIQDLLQNVTELQKKINYLTLDDLRDVNLNGVGDNAQLGYDSETKQWVPFNIPSEDVDETPNPVDETQHSTVIKDDEVTTITDE
jgi:hypothetical protein